MRLRGQRTAPPLPPRAKSDEIARRETSFREHEKARGHRFRNCAPASVVHSSTAPVGPTCSASSRHDALPCRYTTHLRRSCRGVVVVRH